MTGTFTEQGEGLTNDTSEFHYGNCILWCFWSIIRD